LRRALLIALLLGLVAAPLAHADGDPASDWLIGQSTFVPPDAGVSKADQQGLVAMLSSAKAQGYLLRVAVIASAYDMGSVTVLDNHPHLYAPFLSQELRFVYKGRILVVMPSGFAIARDGKRDPAEQRVLAKLPPPKPFQGAPLARATENAVRKLASHAGIVIAAPPPPSGGATSNSHDRILIVIGAAVLVLIAAGVSFWRRRARSARDPSR
jgi:hypothetical protein